MITTLSDTQRSRPTASKLLGLICLAACVLPGRAQAQSTTVLAQIADGGQWQTSIVMTNTGTSTATATLTFYRETAGGATEPWNLSFPAAGSTSGIVLSPGETIVLETAGQDAATSVGWGKLIADDGVQAYAVFTKHVSGGRTQEGTAVGGAATNRILAPFDNTNGLQTGIAFANPGDADEVITASFRLTSGEVLLDALPSLPAGGHASFEMSDYFPETQDQQGLAEFTSVSGTFSMLALRSIGESFTTLPVILASGTPILPTIPESLRLRGVIYSVGTGKVMLKPRRGWR